MNIIFIIKIIALLICLTKLSLESAKTVLFRTKLAMLPFPAARKERLVNLQHQLGKISRRVKDREETAAGNKARCNKRPSNIDTMKPTKRTRSAIEEAANKEFHLQLQCGSGYETRSLCISPYITCIGHWWFNRYISFIFAPI